MKEKHVGCWQDSMCYDSIATWMDPGSSDMKCAYVQGEVMSGRVEEFSYVTDSGHFLV